VEFGAVLAGGGPPVVLDGGLATELEARGHDLPGDLWSARLLTDDPAAITAAHLAFFRAGASIATTATYQASFEGFAALGIERRGTARLMRRGVELAVSARELMAGDGRTRWIAASVGPYGAALADGSEYRGRYGLPVAALAEWHRPRLEVLAGAGADILALETVPDALEAEALVAALTGLDVPAWLSLTIAGGRTRAGQPLDEAYAVAAGVPEIVAVGVNCCDPDDVTEAIDVAARITAKPVIVYPNSGESWAGGWHGPSRFSPGRAREWVGEGARAVGGCCRVSPSDIASMARTLAVR
jgi:homocysteine S-methyltransferase